MAPRTGQRTLTFGNKKLAMERLLGRGAFGEVWLCRASASSPPLAVKLVNDADDHDAASAEALRHKRAMEEAEPDYVPRFEFVERGHMSPPPCMPSAEPCPVLGIAMQYIDGACITAVMAKGRLRERHAKVILNDVFTALGRLHECGIVHCDVKPDNVLLCRTGCAYLCDFGVSVFVDDFPYMAGMPTQGTPMYMAPELLRTCPTRYGPKADVWSGGMLAYELGAGRTPWDGQACTTSAVFEMLRDIDDVDLHAVEFSGPYKALVATCLEVEPHNRAGAYDVLSNPHIARLSITSDRAHLAKAVNIPAL